MIVETIKEVSIMFTTMFNQNTQMIWQHCQDTNVRFERTEINNDKCSTLSVKLGVSLE
jgi:hypothetical protein